MTPPGAGGAAVITPLGREECIAALRAARIGRVVTTVGPEHRPLVRPVSYLYDADTRSVVFHSLPGTKLHALLDRREASFEIDGATGEFLWSVIVRGRVETEVRSREIARFELDISPAVAIPREGPWLRIRGEVITGVRFAAHPGG